MVKSRCLGRIRPGPMRAAIKETHDIDSLFQLLDENNMYCNWMKIHLLETMATAVDAANVDAGSRSNKLMDLIEEYKAAIFIYLFIFIY